MSWLEATIHVIDFEGTRRSGVVEYGVVTLAGGELRGCATRLCAPAGELEPADVRLHGIREADTEGCAPFGEERGRFAGLRGSGVLCAHHAQVEDALLRDVWPVPGTAPDWGRPGEAVAAWGPWLDTRALYARLYPGLDTYKLGALVDTFRLGGRLAALGGVHCPPGRRRAHCALYDALAAGLLLLRLGEEEPGVAAQPLEWVMQASAASAAARGRMRQRDLL